MTLFQLYFWVGSVLLGWALARVLSSLTPLMLAGRRVHWSWETILLTALVVLLIGFVWLDQWAMRPLEASGRVDGLAQVVKLFALHFGAAFVLPPRGPPRAQVDLVAYYDRARRLTFIPLIVALLAFRASRFMTGAAWSPMEWAAALILPAICLVLIFVRRRSVNVALLAGGLAVLGVEAAAYGFSLASPAATSLAGQ